MKVVTKKKMIISTPNFSDVWSLLWHQMGSKRFIFIFGLILSLGQTVVTMLFPLINNLYFDYLEDGQFSSIQILLLMSTVVIFILLIIFILGEYLKKTTITQLNLDLTMKLANEAQRLPLETTQASHSSDLVQRITYDTERTTRILSTIMDKIGNQIITFLLALVYIMVLNWKIGIVLLIVSPLLLLSSHLLRHRLKQMGAQVASQESVVRQCQQDMIQNVEIIRAYGIEDWMEEQFVHERKHLNQLYMKRMWWRLTVNFTASSLTSLIVFGTVIYIGWLAIQGTMTLGALVAFFTLVWRLNGPLASIASLWGTVQEGLGSARRIFALLEADKEPRETTAMHSIVTEESIVLINHVNFSYQEKGMLDKINSVLEEAKQLDDNDDFLLADLSLQIDSGSFIAIVGSSGSGKSTVAKIVAGLLFPINGTISIGGLNPLKDAEYAREKIAYVPQTPYLFSGTIRDNLLMAKPNASDKAIKTATKLALAHDFISSFPDGYGTELREQGDSLSGGQKQRLAIAQAILADRPIWILDEATSALDFNTERQVMQNLLKLAKEQKQTIIVVAHRLTTVQNADDIVVMQQGKIVQRGSHTELLRDENGPYLEMYGKHVVV